MPREHSWKDSLRVTGTASQGGGGAGAMLAYGFSRLHLSDVQVTHRYPCSRQAQLPTTLAPKQQQRLYSLLQTGCHIPAFNKTGISGANSSTGLQQALIPLFEYDTKGASC